MPSVTRHNEINIIYGIFSSLFTMKPRLPVTLLLLFVMVLIASVQTKKNPELYNIVLVGATGDLAKKYLWKALFNLFSEKFVKEKVNNYFY